MMGALLQPVECKELFLVGGSVLPEQRFEFLIFKPLGGLQGCLTDRAGFVDAGCALLEKPLGHVVVAIAHRGGQGLVEVWFLLRKLGGDSFGHDDVAADGSVVEHAKSMGTDLVDHIGVGFDHGQDDVAFAEHGAGENVFSRAVFEEQFGDGAIADVGGGAETGFPVAAAEVPAGVDEFGRLIDELGSAG